MSKAVRTIVADAVGCVLILAITARWSPMAGDWLAPRVGVSPRVARYAVLSVAFIGVVPLLYSAVKNAFAFCRLLVDRVLPASAGDPLGVRVSRQSLQVTLVLAAALGIGVPSVAILRPVMGGLIGGLLLATLVVGIAVHLWRHANVLDHEFESGAEKLTALMARQAGPADAAELHDPSLLPGLDHAVAIRLDAQAFAVSKTLRDVHLRALTGATVVAIRRDGAPARLATGDERLEPGDVLAVVGTDDAIQRARALLDNGPEAVSADEAGP
jgi:CPA2 family monovalent cation:H+ antiporter-2